MEGLPQGALDIMTTLRENGYAAYVVGGCVRDSLLGIAPKDWDLCTSARPEEMKRVFAGCHLVETGLKHGTLTVVLRHVPYEVTTFRVDGAYTDHRHPDGVTFVRDVVKDLARRDFTVNAMAYAPGEGLVDPFGGQQDLRDGLIRCVGVAAERFEEDALRILRALRFASVYGFEIEEHTAEAVHRLYPSLASVAAERIRVELGKLLCGGAAGRILREYTDVMTFLLPEMKAAVGFAQHTPHHRYDVWEHTIRAVEAAPPVEALRLAMLLHDSGKPDAFTMDADGTGHAYGHARISREHAERVLERLKVDHATRDEVLLLVEKHDHPLSCERTLLRRRLSQYGEETLRRLIAVQYADTVAKGTVPEEEARARAQEITNALDALLAQQPCVTLRQLAVRGNDLAAVGVPRGRAIGQCLAFLLEQVVEEKLPNERDALLDAAKRLWAGHEAAASP